MTTSEFIKLILEPTSNISNDDIFGIVQDRNISNRLHTFSHDIKMATEQHFIWKYVNDNIKKTESGDYVCDITIGQLTEASRMYYQNNEKYAHIIFNRACQVIGHLKRQQNLITNEPHQLQNTGKPQQQITIPAEVFEWLQKTICSNGKPFIEKATTNDMWNWLQNKELARLLFTHSKINKNELKGKELKQQISELFFYPKDNEPLKLANNKNKEIRSTDYDLLSNYLATL